VDLSGWARPACVAQVGGFRPPQDPLASWFGRVRVALPGEGWPTTTAGAPMLALAQFNLRELPCRPPQALADVALLTLFLGPWQLPVDEPNGVNWALRAYPSLDGLVPLAEPTPARAGDPKLRKGQSLHLRPFPIRWREHLDLPCRDDLPLELLDRRDAWAQERNATEVTADGTKIGGWPCCIQGQVQWWTGGRLVQDCQYVLQLGSEHKSGLSWGYAGLGFVARQPDRGADGWHLTWQSL
jgi:Domain of unknown function (DUF1963)